MIALPEGGRSRPTRVIAYRQGPAAKSAAGPQPTSRQCVERAAVTLVVTTTGVHESLPAHREGGVHKVEDTALDLRL